MNNINSEDNNISEEIRKDFVTYSISRISFIFVTFLVISGGFCDQLLFCELQRELKNNIIL